MSNIMIVDDQPNLQEFFAEELTDEGYNVMSVYDAESVNGALEESTPDLVLLDLYLNGFEGWDLLRDIKRKNPNIAVLIVTAYDSYANDPRLCEADGYVVKNFSDLDKFKQTIADVLCREPAGHA